jgi:hypothetical protein
MALFEVERPPVHRRELRRLIRPVRRASCVAATMVTGFAAEEEDRERQGGDGERGGGVDEASRSTRGPIEEMLDGGGGEGEVLLLRSH